jgi:hypothetical protein
VSIAGATIHRSQDRRNFKAWREVGTHQGLYAIVRERLNAVADEIESTGEGASAERPRSASPRSLRHTFGKPALLSGQETRGVASALGHASLETTTIYAEHDALDLITAFERATSEYARLSLSRPVRKTEYGVCGRPIGLQPAERIRKAVGLSRGAEPGR